MTAWIDRLNPMRTNFKAMTGCAVAVAEATMDVRRGLAADRKHVTTGHRRSCLDLRAADAAKLIERLPQPDESFHCIVGGTFALFNLTPAVLELAAPERIDALHIATLGFSRQNIEALMQLFDGGQIRRIVLLCSHYFSATSPEIYQYGAAAFADRKQVFWSMRTHAKLLAMQLTDGRTVTVESSANLRSCKNIEQMTIIGDPAVYEFHRRWVEEVCADEN